MVRNSKTTVILLALVVLSGLGVRFYGLGWGLPYHFHSDEFLLASNAEQLRTTPSVARLVERESKFLLYPPVLIFLNIGLVSASTLVRPFSHSDPASLTLFYLLARGIVAGFGLATVILLYFLGSRLYSRTAGLLAAFFLAFTVLHVRDSHFFCTDVPLTFFLVLILYLCLDIVEKKSRKAYLLAGIVTGIAIATKQTALLGIPVILIAHLISFWKGKGFSLKERWQALRSSESPKKLAIVLGTTAIVFLIANPFVVMNPGKFLDMSRRTFEFVKGAQQPQWTFQFTGTTVGYWFTNLLYYGMGPALEIVCLLGILWALAKRKWTDGLVLLFLAIYFVSLGFGYMKFIRYAIPLLPFLCLLGARFAAELYEIVKPRVLRVILTIGLALVGVLSVFYTLAYLNIYKQDDVRIQASRWIHENIPQGSTVLINISYATPLLGDMYFHPQFYDSYTVGFGQDEYVKKDFYTIKVLNLFTYASASLNPPDKFRKYVRERMEDADYIIMSNEHSEQYSFRSREYPAVVQFFHRLYAEELGFRLVKTFEARPAFLGRTINDDRSELTFRLFDHPKVRIFERIAAPKD
ncbi:MAG: glycosyltransferase family 39 protein [Candidatus Aminicenantes bacterium]|nr:glycosyltransferase family 39 protein [Candidatus Aminicenantes bacterium]